MFVSLVEVLVAISNARSVIIRIRLRARWVGFILPVGGGLSKKINDIYGGIYMKDWNDLKVDEKLEKLRILDMLDSVYIGILGICILLVGVFIYMNT
jgi:hypothetical protein